MADPLIRGCCSSRPQDDAQNDPEWSLEEVGQLLVTLPSGKKRLDSISYLDQMLETSRAVFECLERAWASKDCALIDMKIEFGIDDKTGEGHSCRNRTFVKYPDSKWIQN
jgi:hypothetical protein